MTNPGASHSVYLSFVIGDWSLDISPTNSLVPSFDYTAPEQAKA